MGSKMKRLVLSATLAFASIPAQAQLLDDALQKFLDHPGYERHDPITLEQDLNAFWLDLETINPGGNVGPLEKALMLASMAMPSTRTRTQIEYGQLVTTETGPVSFITLTNYNLAPLIREEAIQSYGEENVAGLEEFGESDHMEWRFVFMPVMSNQAILLDVASRTINDDEAATADCGGRPCLDLAASLDDVARWEDMGAITLPDWPRPYPDISDAIATPEHAIAELAVLGYWANAESGAYSWTGGEHPEAARGITPYRFISIDRNLGQDVSIDTAWREIHLNDDELRELSFRRLEIAGDTYFMSARVVR